MQWLFDIWSYVIFVWNYAAGSHANNIEIHSQI